MDGWRHLKKNQWRESDAILSPTLAKAMKGSSSWQEPSGRYRIFPFFFDTGPLFFCEINRRVMWSSAAAEGKIKYVDRERPFLRKRRTELWWWSRSDALVSGIPSISYAYSRTHTWHITLGWWRPSHLLNFDGAAVQNVNSLLVFCSLFRCGVLFYF